MATQQYYGYMPGRTGTVGVPPPEDTFDPRFGGSAYDNLRGLIRGQGGFANDVASPGGGVINVIGGGGGLIGPGAGAGGAILPGAPPGPGNDESGRVPGTTNPISTVLGNLGGIGGIQTGLTDSALANLRKQYPGQYFSTLDTLLGNVNRRAHGDISDLLPEMWTRNAENAVGGGYSGSAFENTKRLRDMGLTRYGLEQDALSGLEKIKGLTPTTTPPDMQAIIAALIDAQRQADIMAGAPNPAAAAAAAKRAAGGGGAGGGGGFGGGRYVTPAAGGGKTSVDDVLKKYGGGGFGPPIIAKGTGENYRPPYGGNPLYTGEPGQAPYTGPVGTSTDFGGSLGWGGGMPWGPGSTTSAEGGFYDPFNTDWLTNIPGAGGTPGGGSYTGQGPIYTGNESYDYGGLFGGYTPAYNDIEQEFYDF